MIFSLYNKGHIFSAQLLYYHVRTDNTADWRRAFMVILVSVIWLGCGIKLFADVFVLFLYGPIYSLSMTG